MRKIALLASAAALASCGPTKKGGGNDAPQSKPELAAFSAAHANDRSASEINEERALVLKELDAFKVRIPDCNDGGDGKLGPTRGLEDGFDALGKLVSDKEWAEPKERERQDVKVNDEPNAFALSITAQHSYESGEVGMVQNWKYGANDDLVFASFAQDGGEAGVDAQVQWILEYDKKTRRAAVQAGMRSASFGLDQKEKIVFDFAAAKVTYELKEDVNFTASYSLVYKGDYMESDKIVTGVWSAERTGHEPIKRGTTTLWDRNDTCLKIRTATAGG